MKLTEKWKHSEKWKHRLEGALYGSVIFLFLQMFYMVFLQRIQSISPDDARVIGSFLLDILVGWGALGCLIGIVVCLAGIALSSVRLWHFNQHKVEH